MNNNKYLERVFSELEKRDTLGEITHIRCENISSIKSLKQAKKELFFLYKNCLLWEDIKDKKCILLLSEAGYGKTTEFQYRYEEDKRTNECTFFLDSDLLDSVSEFEDILRPEDKNTFKNWLASDEEAIFYIDAIDEKLSKNEDTITYLIKLFRKLKDSNKKFFLRISSRPQFISSDGLRLLEKHLGRFKKVRLLPFLDEDIRTFAAKNGIHDPEEFYNLLVAKGLLSYAKIPLILLSLIRDYRESKTLPNSKLEIYENLVSSLIKEHRGHSHRIQALSDTELLSIIKSIAIYMLFSEKNYICEGETEGIEISFRNLPLPENKERQAAIKELFDTLLFEKVSNTCFKFKHKAILEYLSAKYLDEALRNKKMTINKLNSLISKGEKILIPFLDLAGWLATLNKEFRNYWIERDNSLIHRIDFKSLDKHEQQRLFNLFIHSHKEEVFYNEEILNYEESFYRNFEDLKEDVGKVLSQEDTRITLREFAVRATWFNRFSEFSEELLKIALNPKEDYHLRVISILALKEIGSEEEKKSLLTLTSLSVEEDPDDEILGAVLFTLYPGIIPWEELPKYLRHNRNKNLFGLYSSFLRKLDRELSLLDKRYILLKLWNKLWEKGELESDLVRTLRHFLNEIIEKEEDPEKLNDLFFKLFKEYKGNKNFEAEEQMRKIINKNTRTAFFFLCRLTHNNLLNRNNSFLFSRILNDNNEFISKILDEIETSNSEEVRKKLYSFLMDFLWEDKKILFLEKLYGLKEKYEELKDIWDKFSKVDFDEEERVNYLKERWKRTQQTQTLIQKTELKKKHKQEKLLEGLKELAKNVQEDRLSIRFLVNFYYLKKGLFEGMEIEENENGIVKYLGRDFYNTYLKELKKFINWKNLEREIALDEQISYLLQDSWDEYKEGHINIRFNEEVVALLTKAFFVLKSLDSEDPHLENLIIEFKNQYGNRILSTFRKFLEEYSLSNDIPIFVFKDEETYEFLADDFLGFIKNHYLSFDKDILKYRIFPFLIKANRLKDIRDNILDYIESTKSSMSEEFYINLAVFFFIDFELAFEILESLLRSIPEEKKEILLENVFAEFYDLMDYDKAFVELLKPFSPDWEMILIDLIYNSFPEDSHPNGFLNNIHKITNLKELLISRIIKNTHIKVRKFLLQKEKTDESNKSFWQYILKEWTKNYYSFWHPLSLKEIEKIFFHGYHKLRTGEDLFHITNDLLDEVINQIEDSEVGLTKLLFKENGNRRKEEDLQLLIANLLKDKLKNIKVIPFREIQLQNRTKIDIIVSHSELRSFIPIEIKYSDNNNNDRGLFKGILKELLENYMQDKKFAFYFMGVIVKNNQLDIKPNKVCKILERFIDYPDLADKLKEYFSKKGIKEIKDLEALMEVFYIIADWIKYHHNKIIRPKILVVKY